MKKKPQYFILERFAAQINEYAAPSFKTRAEEIKEKYNHKFPALQQSA